VSPGAYEGTAAAPARVLAFLPCPTAARIAGVNASSQPNRRSHRDIPRRRELTARHSVESQLEHCQGGRSHETGRGFSQARRRMSAQRPSGWRRRAKGGMDAPCGAMAGLRWCLRARKPGSTESPKDRSPTARISQQTARSRVKLHSGPPPEASSNPLAADRW